MIKELTNGFFDVFLESFYAFIPLLLILVIMQIFLLKLNRSQMITIIKGMLLTFIGLIFFLHGVNISFIAAGSSLGKAIGSLNNNWLMVPIAFVLGFIVTLAEPAVKILIDEIEEITTGYIKPKLFWGFLATGVGVSVSLAILRILMGLSLWYFVFPSYLIALILTKYASPLFVAIAFDAGGIVIGPLIATFLLVITASYAQTVSGFNTIVDGFGMLSLVAIIPIIMILVLGCLYERNKRTEE